LRLTLPMLLLMLLFCEFVVFRFILPASEWPYRYSIQNGDDAVRYLYKDAPMYHTGIQRLGFPERYAAKYNINREGWNSPREYTSAKSEKTRIAVIGDSFVDAFQVDVHKCFAELLEKNLSPRTEVYRFGFGAAPLTQYLQVLRYVERKFHPDIVIISVQANDFGDSLYGYGNENADFLQVRRNGLNWVEIKPVPYNANSFRLAVKHSATFRYFYGNLVFRYRFWTLNSLFKIKKEVDERYRMNIDVWQTLAELNTYKSLCRYVFPQMKRAMKSDQKLLLFMDADRQAIYEGIDPRSQPLYQLTRILMETAAESGIPVLDLTDAFLADYRQNHKKFDFNVDGHWNERGHEVVARALTRYLNTLQWIKH
jgi:GDSL-like Lipase/Acylhydrolase family